MELKGARLDSRWVPSHTSQQHTDEGVISQHDREGNMAVDEIVGWLAEACEPTEAQARSIATIGGLA